MGCVAYGSRRRLLNASGQRVINALAPCRFCAQTPCAILVTLSGVTLCSGCFPSATGGFLQWAAGSTINQTFCVNYTGGCRWGISQLFHCPTLNRYSNSGCTTLIQAITDWNFFLGYDGTQWFFNIGAPSATIGPPYGNMFYGGVAPNVDCLGAVTIPNTLVAADCLNIGSIPILAYGGNASLTPQCPKC